MSNFTPNEMSSVQELPDPAYPELDSMVRRLAYPSILFPESQISQTRQMRQMSEALTLVAAAKSQVRPRGRQLLRRQPAQPRRLPANREQVPLRRPPPPHDRLPPLQRPGSPLHIPQRPRSVLLLRHQAPPGQQHGSVRQDRRRITGELQLLGQLATAGLLGPGRTGQERR